MNTVKGKEEELKAETENFSDVLWKENKEEAKYQKKRWGTTKEKKRLRKNQGSNFERLKKRTIKDERNKEKSLIGINGGQGNKKQEQTYINSAIV